MKIDDLHGIPGLTESLLGPDPTGLDVEISGGAYVAIDIDSDEEVGRLEHEEWVIRSLEVDDDRPGQIATFLLRQMLADADRVTAVVVVPSESKLAGVSAKRFMERFGFLSTKDGMLERRPGAALPYSVLL